MRQLQVITCRCGAAFAACAVPDCYTEKDWLKQIRYYSLKGCTVDIKEATSFSFEKCTCVKESKTKDKNQTSLILDIK